MKFRIKAVMLGILLVVTGGAFAAEPVTVEDLKGPERVEAFLGLGAVHPFSHDGLFVVDGKGEPPVDLKLSQMVDLAQKTRLEGALDREKVNEALGRSSQALSSLLPQLEGGISQSRTFKENLEAQGLHGSGVIGPFNTFDARLSLVQKIIDISAAANFQSGRAQVNVARYEEEFTRQKIVLAASLLYLDALRAQGAFQAAAAALDLSERLLRQAEARKKFGTAAAIDVARAKTRLAQDQLRLERSRTGLHDAYLELQRWTRIPYERIIRLMNSLCFIREPVPSVGDALATAAKKRIDMRIASERVRAAQYSLTQSRGEWFPSVSVGADYGVSANEPDRNDHWTSRVMVGATMPLFEGGRILGKIKEASSLKHQAELVRDDLSRQVEEDVRKALWTMVDSASQVDTAARVVELARQEMDLASHRFQEGVADNIEVVNAQTSLAQARDEYIAALTQYHAARMNLAFALGDPGLFYLQDATEKATTVRPSAY